MKSYYAPVTSHSRCCPSPVQTTPSRAVLDWTNLPPVYAVLLCHVVASLGCFPDRSQPRHPGSPRLRWIDQLLDSGHPDNMLGDLWGREVRPDRRGGTTRRPSRWLDDSDDEEDDWLYPGFHLGV